MKPDGQDAHIDYATLNDFADGDLTGRSAEAVRSHLQWCAACREEVRFIRSSGVTIRTLPTPKPPDELLADLLREDSGHVTILPLVRRAGETGPFVATLVAPFHRRGGSGAVRGHHIADRWLRAGRGGLEYAQLRTDR